MVSELWLPQPAYFWYEVLRQRKLWYQLLGHSDAPQQVISELRLLQHASLKHSDAPQQVVQEFWLVQHAYLWTTEALIALLGHFLVPKQLYQTFCSNIFLYEVLREQKLPNQLMEHFDPPNMCYIGKALISIVKAF